ncbi:MAG: Trk system potassium transporter TrkA [Deltaproteobacteria bacterium]|nr:Trk system potassium transporter TrkA [Deltaproteobacteria bacterium]
MKILIIGVGQVGFYLCNRLSQEGHEVTLIDRNAERLRTAQDRLNVLGILGNGAGAEFLEQAGIKETDILIAVSDQDEVNILACLVARSYEVPTRIARVKSIEYTGRGAALTREKLGIDLLINPQDAVSEEIINIASRTGVFDVAEFAEGKIQFLGYRIGPESPLCNLSMRELGEIRGMYRFIITAIARGDRTIIPRGDDVILSGDSIYIFAHNNDLPAIHYLLKMEEQKKRRKQRVFILGGGRIGLQIAQQLEKISSDVRIVEHNQARCEELAGKLKRTMVIQAEGDDIRTLIEEGVDTADVFIAVTEQDETNILCSLLCKQHGARRTVSLVNKPELLKLAPTLGIDACVSPYIAAASAILKYVRRGEIITLATIEGSNAEVLEVQVRDKPDLCELPLKKLHFPEGAIIGAIVRGNQYEIATGESVLQNGDRVVVFSLPGSVPKVERFFG